MNRKRLLFAAFALGATLWPGAARASHLDKALLANAGKIIEAMEKEKIKNVGVLPFRVQKGNRQALYAGAPLATNMPDRVENALIMAMDPGNTPAFGVIHDAAGTAARANVGRFLSDPAAYKRLFGTSYALAWNGGKEKVNADGFLTGTVTNTGDRDKVKVEIRLLKAKDYGKAGKLICEFSAGTDRVTLADLGYNFSLSRSVVKRGGLKRGQEDQAAQNQVKQEDQLGQKKPQSKEQTTQHTPDNIAGFSYELYYNDQKQEIRSLKGQQGASQDEWMAPPVPERAKIKMVLTRKDTSQEKMGVLLLVNGKSTFNFEAGDPLLNMRRWIYPPERTNNPSTADVYLGHTIDEKTGKYRPWKALSAEESTKEKADELGQRAGWIDVHVFINGDGPQVLPQSQDEKDMFVTTRAMPHSRGGNFQSVQKQLLRANNVKMRTVKNAKGGLIVKRSSGGLIDYEAEPADGGVIGTDSFPNPKYLGHLAIRYWEGATSKEGRIIEQTPGQQNNGNK